MADTNTALLQARNITKGFPSGTTRIEILQGLDIQVHPGEKLAIVGASGSGKTTLLHILGALDRPDQGEVHFLGKNIFAMNEEGQAGYRNRSIGFLFQFHHLLPEFTALENVLMPALISGNNGKESMAAAVELLARVGLETRQHHRPGQLSGGEQQRVALARALVMRPKVLLADEPTGNLDQASGDRAFALLQELSSAYGLATVMVTHNMELACRMDRTLTMTNGRLLSGVGP